MRSAVEHRTDSVFGPTLYQKKNTNNQKNAHRHHKQKTHNPLHLARNWRSARSNTKGRQQRQEGHTLTDKSGYRNDHDDDVPPPLPRYHTCTYQWVSQSQSHNQHDSPAKKHHEADLPVTYLLCKTQSTGQKRDQKLADLPLDGGPRSDAGTPLPHHRQVTHTTRRTSLFPAEVWLVRANERQQQRRGGHLEQELRHEFLQQHALGLEIVRLETAEPTLSLHGA